MTDPEAQAELLADAPQLVAATRAIAALRRVGEHSNGCPVVTRHTEVNECGCWIIRDARRDAEVALAAALAPHVVALSQPIPEPRLDVERLAAALESVSLIKEGTKRQRTNFEWAEAIALHYDALAARLTSPEPRSHDLADWQDEPGGIDDFTETAFHGDLP